MGEKPMRPSEISLQLTLADAAKRCEDVLGTATFVTIKLDEFGMLHSLNLGDSRYLIIRGNEVHFVSPSRQYKFNHPYQCGTNYKAPYHADQFQHSVSEGDIIVVASDGLWDNIDEAEVIENIAHGFETHYKERGQVAKTYPFEGGVNRALALAHQAFAVSMQREVNGPFANAAKAHGKLYTGGKKDDITVIVAEVSATPKQEMK